MDIVKRLKQDHEAIKADYGYSDNDYPLLKQAAEEIERLRRVEPQWIRVNDRLPEEKYGQSYMKMATGTVAVLHKDRPDYPITAHAYYPMDDGMAFANAIPTNGASKYNYIEWHPCPMLKDKPINFGAGITHWMPLPEPPVTPE